ncbi:MAG: IclR family transcriptional regulator [Aeromicrobium sp.]
MAGNTSVPGASVASRLLAVLSAFDENHRVMTLSDISRRTGLPLPTTYRLVAELAEWSGLVRRPTGEYVVGKRIWELGLLAPTQTGLRQTAEPFLHDVYGATLATVHLAVRDGDQVLYLDRLAGTASVPIVSSVGSHLPLHSTAVGKVLLAHAPEGLVTEVLGSLTRVTPYTVTQPGILRQQLARVRRHGHATTSEEMSLGASSIAVPVLRGATVVAALGVVVPDLRGRPRLVGVLQAAAHGIGRELAQP